MSVGPARRIVFRLWPPLEAIYADKYLEADTPEERYLKSMARLREVLQRADDPHGVAEMANEVAREESSRLQSIEGKAVTFLLSIGVSLAIFAAVPAILTASHEIPRVAALVAVIALGAAIAHFLMAARYVVGARRLSEMVLPSVQEVSDAAETTTTGPLDRAARMLARVEANAPVLTRKANYTFVADALFDRGLVLLNAAALLVVGARVMRFVGVGVYM